MDIGIDPVWVAIRTVGVGLGALIASVIFVAIPVFYNISRPWRIAEWLLWSFCVFVCGSTISLAFYRKISIWVIVGTGAAAVFLLAVPLYFVVGQVLLRIAGTHENWVRRCGAAALVLLISLLLLPWAGASATVSRVHNGKVVSVDLGLNLGLWTLEPQQVIASSTSAASDLNGLCVFLLGESDQVYVLFDSNLGITLRVAVQDVRLSSGKYC